MSKSLSIEELLAKAEAKVKSRRRSENNKGVLDYIKDVNWQVGTTPIPTTVIFWHYRSVWDGRANDNKINKTVFFRTFNKHFPSTRKKNQRYYLLNDGVINLTEELLKSCKLYDKIHWQKKPRKKKTLQLPRQEGNDSN